jgi:hypothetical protein
VLEAQLARDRQDQVAGARNMRGELLLGDGQQQQHQQQQQRQQQQHHDQMRRHDPLCKRGGAGGAKAGAKAKGKIGAHAVEAGSGGSGSSPTSKGDKREAEREERATKLQRRVDMLEHDIINDQKVRVRCWDEFY